MNFYTLSAIINALTSLILGIIILRKKKSNINISFILFCFSVTFWSIAYFLWQVSDNSESALLWCKILTVGSIFIPLFYFRFTIFYLNAYEKIYNRILLYIGYLSALFLALISPTSLLVKDMSAKLVFRFWPDAGSFYWLFLLMFFGFVVYSVSLFIGSYGDASEIKKQQIKFLLFGTGLGFLGGSTNFLLWYNIPILPVGNILVSLYVILTAYAIVVHRLMDIKMVMRRYSVFLASLSVVLVLATAVKYLAETYFYDYTSWADPLILVAALFIFPPIRNYFYRLANRYFFSSLYDSGEVIASLSDKLRTTLETEKIYDFIYQILTNAFHVKAFGLLIYSEADKNFVADYNNGFTLNKQKSFPEDKILNEMFIKKNQPIITEDAGHTPELNGNQTIEMLKKIGVEILAPLNVKDKTIGLIALGKKESGDMYNDEDLKVLEVAGAQTAIALENALLYKETKNFSLKLEKEVERATRDLKKANIQLKKLDAAKSEFISIASHQLRTPLTVIKGYISMMLEGNFGPLTKPEEESLGKVFESNERLIQLVEDLLNISRIESGRLQFNYKETDLNKMAESVVDELSTNAKKKNLILEYKAPAEALPTLKLDDEKVRQVVMNLVDNAIKYTKEGKVTVTVEQAGNKLHFCVADSGMGIKPEDMPNLFKKFSRGTGTSLIHTEGTGLGLYVARMMIEAHKGKVWAESDGVGKGSKFCFELPVK